MVANFGMQRESAEFLGEYARSLRPEGLPMSPAMTQLLLEYLPLMVFVGVAGVIGLALLVSLLAVFAHLRAPFAVVGLPSLLQGPSEMLFEGVSRARLSRLDRAILARRLQSGQIPRTLDELVRVGLVDPSYLKDPWARPYHYALTENGYLLSEVDDAGKSNPSALIERVFPPDKP